MKKFSDLKVPEAITELGEYGDMESVKELSSLLAKNPKYFGYTVSELPNDTYDKPWKIKEHVYAFIDDKNSKNNAAPLINSLNMKADQKLKGSRVNIRIGNIYVKRYPGIYNKNHEVLFDFSAKHSPDDSAKSNKEEEIAFSQKYTLNNKEGSGYQGLFAFKGLNIPSNGIDFRLNTILLGNKNAKKLLGFLDSDVFKSGLQLLSTVNPVVDKAAGYAKGIVNYVTDINKNRVIQEIGLGFDFSDQTEVASLKLGTFVAIQAIRNDVKLQDRIYDKELSLIVHKKNKQRLPYNHITFVVSMYNEEKENNA